MQNQRKDMGGCSKQQLVHAVMGSLRGTNRAAKRGDRQLPASLYRPRIDERRIQSGPCAGHLEWHHASLAMKHH